MRTTNIKKVFPDRAHDPVESFFFSDIQQLDAGSYFGSEFAGTTVPSLKEFLQLFSTYKGRHFIFDLSQPPASHPAATSYVAILLDLLQQFNVTEQVTWPLILVIYLAWERETIAAVDYKYNAENLEARDKNHVDYYLAAGRNTVNAQWTVTNSRLREIVDSKLFLGAWVVNEEYIFKQALPDHPRPGFGNKTLAVVCRELRLDQGIILAGLKKQGITAQPDLTIKVIAADHGKEPIQLYEALRTVVNEGGGG